MNGSIQMPVDAVPQEGLHGAEGEGSLPLQTVVDRLGVLGDPIRVRILLVLGRGEFYVGELCQALRLPQSTMSRHLRTLARAGWVSARSEGTSRLYRRAEEDRMPAAELWRAVKRPAEASSEAREDRERAEAVLGERQERSRAFFRSAAGRWDTVRKELFGEAVETRALPGLLDPDWTVGDLGCGTGFLAATLAPWVRKVIGVDREPEMLDAARLRLGGAGNVELRQGELEALPVADGELDMAFALLVFHLLPDPRAVLAEAVRALGPGGTLVILDMRTHAREEFREEMGHLWTGFEPEKVADWLHEAGLQGVRSLPLPPEPGAAGPLLFLARGRRPPRGRGRTRTSTIT
jgi:ubiquinone/menaquinone biosynthesis C-methylase UbiE/DNA-binding transcriptional ArsR family regulator